MQGRVLYVEIRVHGNTVREYQHDGKIWVEGRKGSEFDIRLKNMSPERVLVVGSVDGLSIMDGKTASYDSGGYILRPLEFITIPGWRLSDDEVAKFFFSKSGQSYAAKMDKPRDIGVIGFAMFKERPQPVTVMHSSRGYSKGPGGMSCNFDMSMDSHNYSASLDPQANAAGDWSVGEVERGGTPRGVRQRVIRQTAKQELGTGFGERVSNRVTTVPFEKASNTPEEVLEIRYDSRQGLQKRGVDLDQRPAVTGEPNAFPGSKGCQPPPGWNG